MKCMQLRGGWQCSMCSIEGPGNVAQAAEKGPAMWFVQL